LAGAASDPIGVPSTDSRPRSESAIELQAGSVLLLYTDDVVHLISSGRGVGREEAMSLLADTVAGLSSSADPSTVCGRA
jgi:Stage II sporulation protein E (SpoIIE)